MVAIEHDAARRAHVGPLRDTNWGFAVNRGVQVSPWVFEAADYQRNVIRITVTFDNSTKELQTGTVYRDAACVYTRIYIGLGADGTPDTSPHRFIVPAGTTTFTAAQMAMVGLNTINDILAFQVTAGP